MNGERVVSLAGDVDLASREAVAGSLAAGLAELDDGDTLVVDVSAVTFFDSTGLSCLVGVHRDARAVGSRVLVRGATPMIERLLAMTGLDQLLDTI